MMDMPHLNNARDAQVISILEAMRYDNKVLEEIDAKKLTQKSKNKKGVLMGICPDGHQSSHKLNRIKEFCEMGKIDGHVHIMECPGGMAAILPDSPMNNEELMNHTLPLNIHKQLSKPAVITIFFPSSLRNFAGRETRFLSSIECVYSPINIIVLFLWFPTTSHLLTIIYHSFPLLYHFVPNFLWISK
jgi:hypothetical protein